MKRATTILLILLLPQSLFAMSKLSESDLSDVSNNNSLNITPLNDSDSIGKSWSRYFNDPNNLAFFLKEDSSDTTETQPAQTFQDSSYTLMDYTAKVSVVDTLDPHNAGMSRIEFPNGLMKVNEGPSTVEIWLGGLADTRNAGKIFDFYSNQIKSYVYPNSALFISTH